ncbi:MAG TPA: DUF5667 domain-containing protein [Patescibacteria group bacterium]|nr:DUF5667 domain-containing protein [Patescibacteria group bacterium]
MKKVFLILFLFFLISAKPTFAGMAEDVLGVATTSALPQISPTIEGPGLILPDSPFFFLDQLKQSIRLAFAFSPEDKAKVNEQIAGERLAELRFMLAKNDARAASVALAGVSDNLLQASDQLAKAQFAGKNVTNLAEDLNSNIKLKQKALDQLESQAHGSLQLQVAQAQESIFESKAAVDDALPPDQMENEIKNDLERKITRQVATASSSAVLLQRNLDALQKEASDSAIKALERREEALKLAIEKSGNPQLRKVQEKLLEQEKEKQEKILDAQKKAAEQAREAIKNSQEATVNFANFQRNLIQLQSTSVPSSSPQPNSTSNGGSGSSEGGSSGGGSGSSGGSGGGETEGSGSGH